MAFQVSPGINVTEIDLSTVVPAVSTSVGAFAGIFSWGPVNTPTLISSEVDLVQKFGKPTNNNFESFFTAANFLAYTNALYVTRAGISDSNREADSVFSATANTAPVQPISKSAHTVLNNDDYLSKVSSFSNDCQYIAKYPGNIGNSLKVSECDNALQYNKVIRFVGSNADTLGSDIDPSTTPFGSQSISINVNSNTMLVAVANSSVSGNVAPWVTALAGSIQGGDIIRVGNSSIGYQKLRVSPSWTGTVVESDTTAGLYQLAISFDDVYKLSTNFADTTSSANLEVSWEYADLVGRAPGLSPFAESKIQSRSTALAPLDADEISVVVVDEDGQFSGVPGTVLEVFANLSRATDAKNEQGASIFYKDVINSTSKYIWVANERVKSTSPVAPVATLLPISVNNTKATAKAYKRSFAAGQDGPSESGAVPFSALASAYDQYKDTETYDVSLVLSGKPLGTNGGQLANYLIDNLAEYRKDCVVFLSPPADRTSAQAIVDWKNGFALNGTSTGITIRSSSYAVLDSGYKQQYDKYNDTYRYVPLNGDIAGLAARTDSVRDPWFSPAGFNRGTIRNIIKLNYNPDKTDRDLLYANAVNPVVTFPGQGTVLYGDKTLLKNPSAFDRINVRRLFIVLEKAIATAAQSTLFEFNDNFTRTQFKNLVEPFLREVQGRRGIFDFKVVCDETNNTPEVIDSNRFVGDIYIKPARSINFIQLNFVAVRSGVEFNEIVGQL